MRKKKVTMQDIADRLNITKVSVSKALKNEPGVSEALRSEIMRMSDEMGYELKKKTNGYDRKNLAVIIKKNFFLETDNFYSIIHYYLNQRCNSKDIGLTTLVLSNSDIENLRIPEQLKKNEFDGVFLVGEICDEYLAQLEKTNTKIVTVDFYSERFGFDAVLTDNFYAGYRITKHLISKGHKTIGFVGNPEATNNIFDRYLGYRKALIKNGIEYNDDWVMNNSDDETGIYYVGTNLPESLPSAFVCHCDMAAHVLMQSLKIVNKAVPGDVSVVSFDNTELASKTTPGLTTVDIDKKQIAYAAFERLTSMLEKEDAFRQKKIYIDTSIIFRDSVSEHKK